jgi:two-component system sensor histidine kinase PhoQ
MKSYSLSKRVLLIAMALVTAFLILIGFVLKSTFEKSVEEGAKSALRTQVLLLLADIDLQDDGSLFVPEQLSEPRLSQIDSGLYAQVTRLAASPDDGQTADSTLLWQSASLLGLELPTETIRAGEFSFGKSKDSIDSQPAYSMSLLTEWETTDEESSAATSTKLLVTVAENVNNYQRQTDVFERQLLVYLTGLGLALLALQFLLLRWSLRPLKQVENEVSRVEAGELDRLNQDYPEEVARLSDSINQLLNHEEKRIARQRDSLGNLAHSLKTPLAVLTGLTFQDKDKATGKQQIDRIQAIIDYQLHQASALGRSQFSKPIPVLDKARQIINSVAKVYADKQLNLELDCQPSVTFVGEEGDFMEVLGNLVENAAKWSKANVHVKLKNVAKTEKNKVLQNKVLQIDVIDDGEGIDDQQRAMILERGIRLDQYTAGHGIGLHIVKSIVQAYDGNIEILDDHAASLGGAHFRILI